MRKWYFSLTAVLVLFSCSRLEEPSSLSPAADPFAVEPLEALPAPAGGPTTLLAGFQEDDTRARIRQDGAEAKVLWTAGDSFTTLYSRDGSTYKATFTTQDDGVETASFTSLYNLTGSGFHCFYPDYNKWGTYNGDTIYGFNLPSTQTAVAGGTADGLNRSYAYADQLTRNLAEPLRFHNLPALLKFRLSGAVVPQIRQVTFTGSTSVAGDLVFHRQGDLLTPAGISFNGDVRSSKVVLTGTFEAGQDYYIALWPCQLSWFRMEFSDGNGNSTRKQSAKAVTFERSRTKDFGTIDLGDAFSEVDDGSMDPIKYMSATQGTKPATIAVVPEGFTKEEMSQYELLAKSGINALFATEPYKTYKDRFNVYLLKVASRESGASVTDGNGNITKRVDSYFGVRWGENSYSDMRADDETVFTFVSENCPDIVNGIHPITEVPVLIIVNDKRYGGRCWNWSDGKAYAMVPYTYEGAAIHWSYPAIVPTTDEPLPTPVTNEVLNAYYRSTTQADYNEVGSNTGDWRNTLVHEYGGHAFGRLADEYWSDNKLNYTGDAIGGHSWTVPYHMNIASDPTAVTWQAELMARREELVARDARYNRIGIFQGGGTYLYGRWRSEKISCMIDNRYYFSAWQRYLIAQRIFSLSGDAASFQFSDWLSHDVTVDPVRDVAGGGVLGASAASGPVREVPLLPPPGFVVE